MEKTVRARLLLENGKVFEGRAFGHVRETAGEIVFTTGMTGYQEVLTDPSGYGKILTFTYPLVGNYGVNLEDMESSACFLGGVVVREICRQPNNWRCEMELNDFLKHHKIMGISGVDTRALTRILRDCGTMKALITVRMDLTDSQVKQKFESFVLKNAVREVTCKEAYAFTGDKKHWPLKSKLDRAIGLGRHVAVIDCGTKRAVLRAFAEMGCKVTVFPAFTEAKDILAAEPDLVFVSGGPGSPFDVPSIVDEVRQIAGKKPLAGVCLGHQIIAMALGCTVARLKFGHHGGNHPVKDTQTGKVYITSQAHEYNVTELTDGAEASFVNVNDQTVEGIRHRGLAAYSLQFSPEGHGGPLDTQFLFHTFLQLTREVN